MSTRDRFEQGFEAWGHFVSRWRYVIVVAAFAATGLAASQLPRIVLDTSTESYLAEDHAALVAYDELKRQFGNDQILLLTIEPDDVFDLVFLERLRGLHDALEDGVPHLDRITSLINIRSVEGRGDELIVGDLLENPPKSAADLAALREKVMSTPSYRGSVISDDGRITSIVIEKSVLSEGAEFDELAGFDQETDPSATALPADDLAQLATPEEDNETILAVKAILAEHPIPGATLHLAGSLMITHEVSGAMMREIPIFFGGSLLVIAMALYVLFRRLAPCLVALLVVTLSVVTTFGTAAVSGITMSILAQVLPSFLLSVGVGYSVHLFAIYFQNLDTGDDRETALIRALRHSGPPILMTALTTTAGLASFLAATMPPVRIFGEIAMIGVGWTLVFNLSLLPALICILPMRARQSSGGGAAANRLLLRIGTTSARHPWKVVSGAALIAVASVLSATRVELTNNPIEYLSPETPYRIAHHYIDDRFGGSSSLEILLDTRRENGLYEPEIMNRLEALDAYFRQFELEGFRFSRPISVLDITKETHQALNGNDPDFYAVPQQRSLLAQELLLFENSGSDDLERVVDSQFRKTRYSIRSPFRDGNFAARVYQRVQAEILPILGPGLDAELTGANKLIADTVSATSISLMRTYAVALAVITPLMMLLIGSLRAGLVSMVPNLLPILLTVGLMPLLSAPLDLFTMMLGCIAIGLAVDDTLHFIHGFRARLALHGDPHLAIEETLTTTGRALLFTSVVLSLGFLVLTFSSMANLRFLGGLTAIAISAAFLLDITVTPALLVLVTRRPQRTPASCEPAAADQEAVQ